MDPFRPRKNPWDDVQGKLGQEPLSAQCAATPNAARPPLGVKPYGFHLDDRATELCRAIHEYHEHYKNNALSLEQWRKNTLLMSEWAEELAENLKAQVGAKK